jgi:hypothetical protein
MPWFSVHPTGMRTTSFFLRFSISCLRTVVWIYAPGTPSSGGDGTPYSSRTLSISFSEASQISFFSLPTSVFSNTMAGFSVVIHRSFASDIFHSFYIYVFK